ncbi:MAG: tetratricopeptide repeat protein [Myxococcota bacterium]
MAISSSPAEPPENLPTTLGRYTLERVVGRGAAGVVYLATLNGPAGFRKRLALKLIQGTSTTEGVSEARLGALLDHPNLVGIYDLAREGPWWLIAMEWVPGPTLLELLQNVGAMPGLALQQLAGQLASALDHAHNLAIDGRDHPIVHRDLKPSNVLVTPSAMVKVADLGLATLAGAVPDVPIGTPGYMAPEQLVHGGAVGPRADQFALGILLAEMALGRRMVRGKTIEDVRARHRRIADEIAQGLLQRQLDAAIEGLGDIVARCLALDPADRFDTCAAVRHAVLSLSVEGAELADWVHEVSSGQGVKLDDDATSLAIGPSNIEFAEHSLFGRAEDLARLEAAVQNSSLVTVHGPGGMGKSALVQRYGATSARQFTGGAWWCDASGATDVTSLCSAVAGAFDLPLDGETEEAVLVQVGHQLRVRGELVILLDGVDRALDATKRALDTWFPIADRMRVVVTSRQRLRHPKETVIELGPLASRDAVDLLRDRANAAGRAGLMWTTSSAEPVLDELARRLDGLPLAIELAAARARVLTPDQLLKRLDDRFRVLANAGGEKTLENVLRESWEELGVHERTLLAQLAVFREGFAVEDAEGVVTFNDSETRPYVLDLLSTLLDRSLVVARTTSSGQPRFHLYESIRLFAYSHLDNPRDTALRHARWFGRRGRPESIVMTPWGSVDSALARDLGNFEAGAEAAIEAREAKTAARCTVAAGRVLMARGPVQRGLELARQALTVAPDHPGLLTTAARIGTQMGEPDALVWAERALAMARDPRERADARHVLGRMQHRDKRLVEACGTLERALREARQIGNPQLEGQVALSLGRTLSALQRPDARGMLGYALRLGRRSKSPTLHTEALVQLGRHALDGDDLDGARRWLVQAIDAAESLPTHNASARNTLGTVERLVGNLDEARRHYLASLAVYRRLGRRRDEVVSLSNLAIVAGISGDLIEAQIRLESARAVENDMGDGIGAAITTLNLAATLFRLGDLSKARERVDEARSRFETVDAKRQMGSVNLQLALLALEGDEPHRALKRAQANVEVSAGMPTGRLAQRVPSLAVKAQALSELGREEEALQAAEEACNLSIGEPMLRSMAVLELGVVRRRLGQPDAQEALEQAVVDAEASADTWAKAQVALRWAELAMLDRDAVTLAERANAIHAHELEPMRGFAVHARALQALAATWQGATPTEPVLRLIEELEGLGFAARARRLREGLAASPRA